MKKLMKRSILIFLIAFIPLLMYGIYEAIHLKLYLPNVSITVSELTPEQKEEDFIKLTKLVHDIYPFSSILKTVKGVTDINSLSQDYIKRAKDSSSNVAFLQLFIEYTDRLRQAGHGGVVFMSDFNIIKSYTYDIGKDAFLKSQYWMQLASTLNLYYHANISINYVDGVCIVANDITADGILIPQGSVLKEVNSLAVDEYVLTLQDITPLRYDDINHKPYTTQIFIKDPGENAIGWESEFKLSDGTTAKVMINKLMGYKDTGVSKLYPEDNIFLKSLTDQVGYIKINTFELRYTKSDNEKIQEYMKINGKKLNKIIIDLRGNTGGELTYWMDLLIRPLLKETMEYTQVTAVKKEFFNIFSIRYPIYRFIYNNDLLDKKSHHITDVKKISISNLDSNQWFVYEITKKLTPNNTFPFNGQVYILVDNDTLSAADSFVSGVRELGLGTIIGTNTYGLGNAFMSPVTFFLPHSGLMFQMDVELAYNADNRETSIYGTKPDIILEPSQYPTTYTLNYEIETLLSDEWIQWCITQ